MDGLNRIIPVIKITTYPKTRISFSPLSPHLTPQLITPLNQYFGPNARRKLLLRVEMEATGGR
jgi:hypothetical protein